jgi:hypothetical protein
MLGIIAAAALTFSTPAANDCTADARAECVELMQVLYRSANSVTGAAVRLRRDEHRDGPVRMIVRPHALATVNGARLLIVSSETEEHYHVDSGTWSLYVFDADTPTLIRAIRDFRYSGSFGHPGNGSLVPLSDGSTALVVDAGGTWQGHTCGWTSVDLIDPRGARALLGPVLTSFSERGSFSDLAPIAGEFESLTSTTAELVYDDGRRFNFTMLNGRLRTRGQLPQAC